MVLSGAFVVPHGALILDANPSYTDGRYELHQAMTKVANKISEIQPDLILITSPHGIALSEDFGIYFNSIAHGTAEWEGEYQEYQVDVKLDLEFSQELYTFLHESNVPISKITAFSQGVPIPMRWGESVPLWFLKDLETVKYCILSQPRKRYEPSSDFLNETISVGKNIGKFINTHKMSVVVIISADLAHTHQENGPYGFYEHAEQTDQLLEQWMDKLKDTLPPPELVEQINKALCCGNTGFYMLHGILSNFNFTSKVLCRSAPTYYGMMVAYFHPNS
jgi:aromatic ring-opening dioxygenase LigB subunit